MGKGGTPLVGPLRAGWTSGGKPQPGAEVTGSLISGAMPHLARPALPAAQVCGVGTVTGHPVTHQPGTSRSSLTAGGSIGLGPNP